LDPAAPETAGDPRRHLGITELQYDYHVVDDDEGDPSSGNGDALITCRETIELYVYLVNPAGDIAIVENATIGSDDPYVQLTGTSSTYPIITVGDSQPNDTPFVFGVDSQVPDGHAIHFELQVSAIEGDTTVAFDAYAYRHCAADVTCDTVIDLADVSAVAGKWRSLVGPGSIYDLDGDGTVTVVDVMLVAAQWQSPCP
jgi:hypothetical protein